MKNFSSDYISQNLLPKTMKMVPFSLSPSVYCHEDAQELASIFKYLGRRWNWLWAQNRTVRRTVIRTIIK